MVDQYLSAMQNELQLASTTLNSSHRPIISIFWGGGTPSLLTSRQIARILNTIAQHFTLSKEIEVTIEANPSTIDDQKARELVAIGINRVSLGVQSFDSATLHKIGRQHEANQTINSVRILQHAGLTNLNLDLMYGLPGQTVDMATTDLVKALELKPTHISWYQLTLTPDKQQLWQTQGRDLPDPTMISQIEQAGRHLLAQHNMHRYEISAYATSFDARCVHNLNYWSYGDYLGIGAGACEKITISDELVKRTQKTPNPASYLKNTIASTEWLDKGKQQLEFMLNVGRLLLPIPYQWLSERTNCDKDRWLIRLQGLARAGLLKMYENEFVVTERGSEMLDSWLLEFA